MWKNATHGRFKPILNIITPSWLKVDKATIFLKSHSVLALKPAINVVEVAIRSINSLKKFS
jgi:hypothetical protein